jgi:hypothetical protein
LVKDEPSRGRKTLVTPAQAGVQGFRRYPLWFPAFAGMTWRVGSLTSKSAADVAGVYKVISHQSSVIGQLTTDD